MSKRDGALEVLKTLYQKLDKELEKVQQKLEEETKQWKINQLSGEFYALQRAHFLVGDEIIAYAFHEKGD